MMIKKQVCPHSTRAIKVKQSVISGRKNSPDVNTMFLMIIVEFFLLLFFVQCQDYPSPCPDLFQYEPGNPNEPDRWYGRVLLTTDRELFDGIWLILIFDRPFIDVKSTFGRKNIKLKETENLLKTLGIKLLPEEPLSVRFSVKYDLKDGPPKFLGFRINTRTACPKVTPVAVTFKPTTPSTTTEGFVTSEELEDIASSSRRTSTTIRSTTLQNKFHETTTEAEFIFNNYVNSSFYPGDVDFAPMEDIPNLLHFNNVNQKVQCGTVVNSTDNKGRWPWHALLYNYIGTKIMYICGGNLISNRHVLTAAHCVTKPRSNTSVDADILFVFLGKASLKSFGPTVQAREVSVISVHPKYNFNVLFNDIAILTLSEQVDFTNFVRPVCLWEDYKMLNTIYESSGIVVGHGYDAKKEISSELKAVDMTVIRNEECIIKKSLFHKVVFEKNYCANFRNETAFCNGDSGGGMVFQKLNGSRNIVWQLRGLVSIGSALQGKYVCSDREYVVFTDVAKHLEWMKNVIVKN